LYWTGKSAYDADRRCGLEAGIEGALTLFAQQIVINEALPGMLEDDSQKFCILIILGR